MTILTIRRVGLTAGLALIMEMGLGAPALAISDTAGAGPPSTFVHFNCGGYGTRTYRTRYWGNTTGDEPENDYSYEIRVAC